MSLVSIFPISARAKNRIREYGNTMILVIEGTFNGDKAILVESLDKIHKGNEKWMGWLTVKEATWHILSPVYRSPGYTCHEGPAAINDCNIHGWSK